MYKRILVALDGSELSESVLPYARFFASTLKIPVELLHVIDPVTLISTTVEQRRYHDAIMGARERNNDYLKKVAVSFSDALTVDCTVEVGKPEEVIVDRAADDTGTLIAIATHGRSGIKRWLLGSVANKILQAAAIRVSGHSVAGCVIRGPAAQVRLMEFDFPVNVQSRQALFENEIRQHGRVHAQHLQHLGHVD